MSCPSARASELQNRDQGLCSFCVGVIRFFCQDLYPPQDLPLYRPYSYLKKEKIWLAVSIINCSHFSLKLSQIMETTWHLVPFMCMLILEKTICCSNTAHSMTQVIETEQDFYLFYTAPINWNFKNVINHLIFLKYHFLSILDIKSQTFKKCIYLILFSFIENKESLFPERSPMNILIFINN